MEPRASKLKALDRRIISYSLSKYADTDIGDAAIVKLLQCRSFNIDTRDVQKQTVNKLRPDYLERTRDIFVLLFVY